MNAWSHLPNACHIDRVLESVKSHPETWDATRDTAWDAAWGATLDATWDAPRDAAWGATLDATRDAALSASRGAAWGAIIALIAYDDASKYLDMPSDQLRIWAILSEDPASVLLLQAVISFEQIRELDCV